MYTKFQIYHHFLISLALYFIIQMDLAAQCNYSPVSATKYNTEECNGRSFQALSGTPLPIYGTSGSFVFTSTLTSGIIITYTKEIGHHSITLYPNPTIGDLTIEWHYGEDVDATIISTLGQIVRKYRFLANTQIKVDVSELPPGFYSLFIKDKQNKTYSQKFVKQ